MSDPNIPLDHTSVTGHQIASQNEDPYDGGRSSRHRNRAGHHLSCLLIAAVAVGGLLDTGYATDLRSMSAGLSTLETSIEIEAGIHTPRLTRLALRGETFWDNRLNAPLPDQAEVRDSMQPLHWQLDRASSRFGPQQIQVVYRNESPRLKLVWSWIARARRGPIEHEVVIENLSPETVWLSAQPDFQFDWVVEPSSSLERFWVEKGADTPSAQGTHLDPLREGDTWQGLSTTYARPLPNQPREMIPYVLVEESAGTRRGWYLGIEFSGRTRIALRRETSSLRGSAGLNPEPGPFRTRVLPGTTFAAPTIFIGTFKGGPDGAGNILRRWVREVLNNPNTLRDPSYPPIVVNSWGSGMAVSDDLARRMIVDSAQLGVEMFHLDAGWFRDVGDWHAHPAKFPRGIASVADFAHQHGLKFGLWADWAQAGTSTQSGALNIHDPTTRDWLITDPPGNWQHREPFKGITIDIGLPAARQWVTTELERLISEYHLDMLEHDGYLVAQGSSRTDHPAAPPAESSLRVYEDSGYLWADSSNSTDVSYHATRAYYEIYDGIRARHPQLLLEICNDGGRMVDFGSAAHGDYFSITDTYDPLSNRRAFYDASYVLPPAMLESYVADWSTSNIAGFRYQLRSGMLGWFSLMLDPSRWNAWQRAEARIQLSLYKSALRPLIRTADLYHVSSRPDGVHWDGIEYYSTPSGRGVLYAFRGSATDEPTHQFQLQGLVPEARYTLSFQDQKSLSGAVLSGRELMSRGITLNLQPLSSELVFFEQVTHANNKRGRASGLL